MSVAELEAEVKEFSLQLETVQAGLQADPDNSELATLETELQEVITLTKTAIAELKPKPAVTQTQSTHDTPPPNQKWSKENHPAFQSGFKKAGGASTLAEPEKDEPVSYKVNDAVLAKWKSGDRGFYPAKISSITGSSAKPVYIVTFKGYNNTETLLGHEIKPATQHAGQKRKADGPPINPSAATPSNPTEFAGPSSLPGVISAAATVDPALASQARKPEPSKVGDGPPKPAKMPKKIKNNKELEAGKNKWQDFAANKGKMGKIMKKKSMFTTGDGVNARGMFVSKLVLRSWLTRMQWVSPGLDRLCARTKRERNTYTTKTGRTNTRRDVL